MAKNKAAREIFMPGLALFLICLVCAAALAFTQTVTAQPILAAEQRAADEKKRELFPQAASFESIAARDGDGTLLGYVVQTDGKGYGGEISVMVGFDTTGTVIKVIVMNADSETPGLGQNVMKESWLRQFAGLTARQEIDVGHTSPGGKQIDAVASATFSSKGVAAAVRTAQTVLQNALKGER
jgi:Na+-translocating ferredoxin:NAD+ oxidoreductase RnfG subunit